MNETRGGEMEATTIEQPKGAPASARAATNTKLVIGTVEAAVGLFTTEAKPSDLADFDRAGPNGGQLRVERRAGQVKVADEPAGDEPVRADPLTEDVFVRDP